MKKITLTTVKSFIKNNRENLLINVKSSFDGMTDCCESQHEGFKKAEPDKTQSLNSDYHKATQGIKGAWFVGSSRDYFNHYETDTLIGIEVYNSCGTFILAIEKAKEPKVIEQLTSRTTRNQIRLNKAASRYAKRVRSGANTVRYL